MGDPFERPLAADEAWQVRHRNAPTHSLGGVSRDTQYAMAKSLDGQYLVRRVRIVPVEEVAAPVPPQRPEGVRPVMVVTLDAMPTQLQVEDALDAFRRQFGVRAECLYATSETLWALRCLGRHGVCAAHQLIERRDGALPPHAFRLEARD